MTWLQQLLEIAYQIIDPWFLDFRLGKLDCYVFGISGFNTDTVLMTAEGEREILKGTGEPVFTRWKEGEVPFVHVEMHEPML